MDVRKGSIVSLRVIEANGPGSQDSTESGREVLDMTDSYISTRAGTNVSLHPWTSLRYVTVTTY